ncbi:MAG: hypothetical protein ACI4UH_05570 [Dorea sp.]
MRLSGDDFLIKIIETALLKGEAFETNNNQVDAEIDLQTRCILRKLQIMQI